MNPKNKPPINPLLLIGGIFAGGFLLVAGALKGLPAILAFLMKNVSQKLFFPFLAITKASIIRYMKNTHNETTIRYLNENGLTLLKKRRAFFDKGPFQFEEGNGNIYKVTVKNREGEVKEAFLRGWTNIDEFQIRFLDA